jgi:biopolymer transport protein ExbD/biopolymer transport protein TolR
MAFTTPQGRTSLSEINVTPLVDVMLVLDFFMVTAPMPQTGIDVELPETRNVKEVNPEERIVISISREGLIHYGSDAINFPSIPGRLKREAKSPKDSIFLRAGIDAIRGAGFNEIRPVTKPFKESRSQ